MRDAEKREPFRHLAFASGISHLPGDCADANTQRDCDTMKRTYTAAYFYFSYRLLTGDHGGARM
jgi:hypothetical protein